MKIVILAAGIGSRLGMNIPKCLVEVHDGRTILDAQLSAITKYIPIENVFIVVGYRKELVIEQYPHLNYIYNEKYATTNTSKSLLKALTRVRGNDVLWLNGDVWFAQEALRRVLAADGSCVAVNTSRVADEEIKYRVNEYGAISHLSKSVTCGLGEAVGINKVASGSVELLITSLEQCDAKDYFEAGIEKLVSTVDFYPVDVSGIPCMEIDFPADLSEAGKLAV